MGGFYARNGLTGLCPEGVLRYHPLSEGEVPSVRQRPARARSEAKTGCIILAFVQDALSACFCVLEGVLIPEQNALPNTYYSAKQ